MLGSVVVALAEVSERWEKGANGLRAHPSSGVVVEELGGLFNWNVYLDVA